MPSTSHIIYRVTEKTNKKRRIIVRFTLSSTPMDSCGDQNNLLSVFIKFTLSIIVHSIISYTNRYNPLLNLIRSTELHPNELRTSKIRIHQDP